MGRIASIEFTPVEGKTLNPIDFFYLGLDIDRRFV